MSSCILGPITSIAFGSAQFQGLFCSGARHSQQSYPWLLSSAPRDNVHVIFMLFNACSSNSNPGSRAQQSQGHSFRCLIAQSRFRRNTASPRCVSLVRRPFLCPLTINPTQRHYSVGNNGREISDHIFQGCFCSHQKYCKNLLRAILARTNVIPSGSIRSWGAIIGGETKSEGQVYVQGYII